MPKQTVMVGRYTYAWDGPQDLAVGDVVVLPPNQVFPQETQGTVTSLTSDYRGPLASVRGLVRTRQEEVLRMREEESLLKDHRHAITWWLDSQDKVSSCVEYELTCGCTVNDIHRFASQMRRHYGWDVRTSRGHGRRWAPGEPEQGYVHVATRSLSDPRSQACHVPGEVEDRLAEDEVKAQAARERSRLFAQWSRRVANGTTTATFEEHLLEREERQAATAERESALTQEHRLARGRAKLFVFLATGYYQGRSRGDHFDYRQVHPDDETIGRTCFSALLDEVMAHPEVPGIVTPAGPIRSAVSPRLREILTENHWWITGHQP